MSESESSSEEQKELQVIKSAHKNLKNTDWVAQTVFSGLFHEARTTSNHYNSVVGLYNIEDGELVEETINPVENGYLPPEFVDSFDLAVGINVQPFMRTEHFIELADRELKTEVEKRTRIMEATI